MAVTGDPAGDAAQDLVTDVRDIEAPFETQVAGPAADFVDQQQAIADALPLAAGLLVGMTLIVLWLMTGSVVLPIKAVLMNALTVGASLGALVFVYQGGRFTDLLGYTPNGGIEPTDFLVATALVFALSTDYGVFLLGRIKELRDAGEGEREAVAIGLQRTGAVVTAAAILLAVAIGAFATSSISFIQQVGIATAFGVLVDAFIVRSLLVPALMGLLGKYNWWAPMWLRRLHDRIGFREESAPASERARARTYSLRRMPGRGSGDYRRRMSLKLHPLLVDVGIAAVLAAAMLRELALDTDSDADTTPAAVAVIVLAVLPVALLRSRRPGWALALSMLALIPLQMVLPIYQTIPIPSMVAGYSYAVVADRRRAVLAASLVAPAVLANLVVASDHGLLSFETFKNLAFVFLPLALGAAVHDRRAYQDALIERAETAERTREEEARRRVDEERLRIARDLHDMVAHSLVAINVQAGVAAHVQDPDPETNRQTFRDIKQVSGEALGRPAYDARRAARGRRRGAGGAHAGAGAGRRPRGGAGHVGGRGGARPGRRHEDGHGHGRRDGVPDRAGSAHQRHASRRADAGARHPPAHGRHPAARGRERRTVARSVRRHPAAGTGCRACASARWRWAGRCTPAPRRRADGWSAPSCRCRGAAAGLPEWRRADQDLATADRAPRARSGDVPASQRETSLR